MDNSTSRCVPLAGYFDDFSSTVCSQCATGCSICPNTSSCTACFVDYYLRGDNFCYTTCLPYFFANRSSLTCDPCPYDCYTCSSSGNCLSCNDTTDFRQLNSNSSRCVPMNGYFENLTTICPQCPSVCSSCLSLTLCTYCALGNFLRNDSMCYPTCQPRHYGDNLTLICLSCPYDCYTCNSYGQCLSCNRLVDHRILDNNTLRCIAEDGYY